MAKQQELLEAIAGHPDGVDLPTLATEFGVKSFSLTKPLSDLRKKGAISHIDQIYQIVTPLASATEKPAEPIDTGVLPGEYDKFKQIGKSLGLTDPFLGNVCDYIFELGAEDVSRVYEGLLRLSLRPDVVQRWVALWGAFLGKPLPREVATPLATATTAAPKRFSVVGENVVGDPEGELSFYQALGLLETKLAKQSQPQQQPGSEELKALRDEIRSIRDKLDETRYSTLTSAVGNLQRQLEALAGQKEAASKFGIIDHGLGGILDEAKAFRTDLKPIIQDSIAARGQPIKKRSPQEIEGFSRGLDKGIEKERRLREMENHLFFGKEGGPYPQQSGRKQKRPPAPPPSVPELTQVFE